MPAVVIITYGRRLIALTTPTMATPHAAALYPRLVLLFQKKFFISTPLLMMTMMMVVHVWGGSKHRRPEEKHVRLKARRHRSIRGRIGEWKLVPV